MANTSEPWTKPNPRKAAGKASKPLSPSQNASAKASAKRGGRATPSLVDNMQAAKKTKGTKKSSSKATKKTAKVAKRKAAPKNAAAKKTSAKTPAKAPRKSPSKSATKTASTRTAATSKSAGAKPTKDPKGGLTAAGRAAFAKSQGSHLKPGIKKPMSAMTPMEMKRKGSWAVRFFARDPLPPLVDKAGQPTRLALSAHAWGEPVPKTEAAARKIAAKGEKLLARYAKSKATS